MERDSFCSQLKHISGAWIKFVVHLLKHIRGAWLKLGFSFKYYTFIHLWKTIFFSSRLQQVLNLYCFCIQAQRDSTLPFWNFSTLWWFSHLFLACFWGFDCVWGYFGWFFLVSRGGQLRTSSSEAPDKDKKKIISHWNSTSSNSG